MATLGATVVGLADIAKQKDPDGSIATIAEVLSQDNEVIPDVPWYPSNKDTSHVMTVRTGIPQPSLRRLNEGISPTKSTNAQIEDGLCHMEDKGLLDVDMPAGGNLAKVRMNENKAKFEGFAQYFTYLLFYGSNQIDERQFNGLSIRYNAVTGNVADNQIDAGGTGTDNTSVWLVGWGEDTIFGIYPKGTEGGLIHEDMGREFVPTSVTAGALGSGYYAWADRFVWKCGLGVKDYRYAVRIHSIDVSDLTGATGTQASTASTYLIDLLADAIERIPNKNKVNLAFYGSRTVRMWVRRQSAVKASNQIMWEKPAGTLTIPTLSVHGVPFKVCDQLIHTEDDVPASLAEFP